MCGICGLLSPEGDGPVDPGVVRAMTATLVHRGPDSEGVHVEGSVGLGVRRLSIIDLEGGDQPIGSEDGAVRVVQNGEIYNYERLRRDLAARGHRLATRSDTEVLAHLYEERGPEFVQPLRGMFAIAVWDAAARRLVLARDPFGIKPLFYAFSRGRLAFASELKALMAVPWLSRDVDPEAVEAFLAFNSIPAPHTIYRGVRKLPPGHLLCWQDGRISVRRYERPGPLPAAQMRREPASILAGELRDRLRDSVRAHLVADVPVGVLLSGGVDSSALAALAAPEVSGRLRTFSIGFEERSFDELDRARLVARRFDTDHHELVVRPDAAELLPKLAAAFDEPFADSSALPTYLVSQLAADHVKVVLSGEGGDEMFGGYFTYVADLLADRVGPLATRLRPVVERLPSSSRKVSFDYRAKRFVRGAGLAPLERHHAWKEIFGEAQRDALLVADRRSRRDPLDLLRERFNETEAAEPLARLQDVDLGIYLVDDLLVKTDRASMAHSLEARVPFLDCEVAGLAMALPTAMKVRGLGKKRLLRQAVRPLLPRSIVDGRKQGFSIPAAAWLRGDLEPFARDVLAPQAVRRQGWFEPGEVTRLIDSHVAGEEDHSRQLWGLMAFSLWADRSRGEMPSRSAA